MLGAPGENIPLNMNSNKFLIKKEIKASFNRGLVCFFWLSIWC